MGKNNVIFAIILLMINLVACGTKNEVVNYNENTVVLHENGNITEYIVEDFVGDDYDFAELKEKIKEDILQYNEKEKKERIKLIKEEFTEGTVRIVIQYEHSKDFELFNQISFFVGTIEDGQKENYDLNITLKSTSNEETLEKKEWKELDKNLLLFQGDFQVIIPSQIQYISEGVTQLEQKKCSGNESMVNVVIY